jgi:hypothetical protein
MSLADFGASCGIGGHVIALATQRGHHVRIERVVFRAHRTWQSACWLVAWPRPVDRRVIDLR